MNGNDQQNYAEATRLVEIMRARWAGMSFAELADEIRLMHEQHVAHMLVELACNILDEKTQPKQP